MASTSPSTPSEGEIVESDLEKAKPSTVNVRGISVDRNSRKYASISRSPSPIRPTRPYRSRSRSRSPYRKPQGAKRPREDSRTDRARDDPRRFKVRYEDRLFEDRRRLRDTDEALHRYEGSNHYLGYDDTGSNGRLRDKNRHFRSRSPRSARSPKYLSNDPRRERETRSDGRRGPNHGSKGRSESSNWLSKQQSVSDRGHSSVATVSEAREAEIAAQQKQHNAASGSGHSLSAAEYVHP